jgi:hypothetical protein
MVLALTMFQNQLKRDLKRKKLEPIKIPEVQIVTHMSNSNTSQQIDVSIWLNHV